MSKKINVDFTAVDEFELGDRYWTPPSQDYFGSYGYNEVRVATANYLNIGDVGDEEWRGARSLPFGDEALEAFYPGSRGISFIQYPWEHPDADDVDENPVTRMLNNDLAFDWAVKEMETLEMGSERYNQLADLLSEIRSYNTSQIEEEAFIHAPSWAMDILLYAQDRAYDSETTKIIEEFGPRKSMAAKVISTTMYPDTQVVKSIGSIYDEYDIKLPEGSRQHCFALKNGKKVFGPYGDKFSCLKMFKSSSTFDKDAKKFRWDQMIKVLNDVGIIPVFNDKYELESINHEPVNPDNLLQAKVNYSTLANVINDANSTTAFIVQHIKGLQEDAYWDKLKSYLVKANSYTDVLDWSASLNKENKSAPCLSAIGHIGLSHLIDDYETLRSDIYTKINTTYYALIAGKNNQIAITDSKEKAEYFKNGNADDIIYFLLDKKSQDRLGTLSDIVDTYGYESSEYKAWQDKALKALANRGKYSEAYIQKLVSQYNMNRRVKTITSRVMKECGWLLADLPFTRAEINILNDSLEAYGRAIVAAQQRVPVIRQVFGRLKTCIEADIRDDVVPKEALDSIRSKGTVNFVYSVKNRPLPDVAEQRELLAQGLLSKEEISSGRYLHISLDYDYVFTNPSDVFRYVSNFAVTPTSIRLANSK